MKTIKISNQVPQRGTRWYVSYNASPIGGRKLIPDLTKRNALKVAKQARAAVIYVAPESPTKATKFNCEPTVLVVQ